MSPARSRGPSQAFQNARRCTQRFVLPCEDAPFSRGSSSVAVQTCNTAGQAGKRARSLCSRSGASQSVRPKANGFANLATLGHGCGRNVADANNGCHASSSPPCALTTSTAFASQAQGQSPLWAEFERRCRADRARRNKEGYGLCVDDILAKVRMEREEKNAKAAQTTSAPQQNRLQRAHSSPALSPSTVLSSSLALRSAQCPLSPQTPSSRLCSPALPSRLPSPSSRAQSSPSAQQSKLLLERARPASLGLPLQRSLSSALQMCASDALPQGSLTCALRMSTGDGDVSTPTTATTTARCEMDGAGGVPDFLVGANAQLWPSHEAPSTATPRKRRSQSLTAPISFVGAGPTTSGASVASHSFGSTTAGGAQGSSARSSSAEVAWTRTASAQQSLCPHVKLQMVARNARPQDLCWATSLRCYCHSPPRTPTLSPRHVVHPRPFQWPQPRRAELSERAFEHESSRGRACRMAGPEWEQPCSARIGRRARSSPAAVRVLTPFRNFQDRVVAERGRGDRVGVDDRGAHCELCQTVSAAETPPPAAAATSAPTSPPSSNDRQLCRVAGRTPQQTSVLSGLSPLPMALMPGRLWLRFAKGELMSHYTEGGARGYAAFGARR